MIPNRKAVVDCAFHRTVFDTACSTDTGCGMGLSHHAASQALVWIEGW